MIPTNDIKHFEKFEINFNGIYESRLKTLKGKERLFICWAIYKGFQLIIITNKNGIQDLLPWFCFYIFNRYFRGNLNIQASMFYLNFCGKSTGYVSEDGLNTQKLAFIIFFFAFNPIHCERLQLCHFVWSIYIFW